MGNLSLGKSCRIALLATAAIGAFTLSQQTPATAQAAKPAAKLSEWKAWGGDGAVTHFSPLTQITAANVSQLKPVWIYDPGTVSRSWENTPLMIDGMLYISDAITSDVVAIEPETGKEVWRMKPDKGKDLRMRGLAYWGGDGSFKPRIIVIWGSQMNGLDLKTGKKMADWPAEGYNIMLPSTAPASAGAVPAAGNAAKSAPVIYKNKIVLADATGFQPGPGRPADPRAYDLKTGKLLWRTRLIPAKGEKGDDSWGPGTQDVLGSGTWGFLSVDEKTGTIYVPTDSGSPDLVGVWRPGDNVGADSTFALDAETGKIKWGFQNHHHDIFDQDTMSAPVPVTVNQNGKKRDMVVQTTKQGMMWILDAKTGQPVHGMENRPVPQSEVPGEKTAATQPFTVGPPPLAQMTIARDNLQNLSDQSNADCKQMWDELKLSSRGPWTPPAKDGAWTVMIPGAAGGIDWGGASVDPDRGWAITNVTNMPTMVQVTKGANAVKGNDGYRFSSGYVRFSDTTGVGCAGGRQGELIAVNLASGKIEWRVPLGELDEQFGARAKGVGATNIGPSLVTRGGVIFIGAATDQRFHAYDTKTGKLLWQTKMSAAADAGPMTYIGKDGRQYVVIAAGGPGSATLQHPGTLDDERGDDWGYHQTLVAFALPRPGDKDLDIVKPYPKRLPKPGEKWIAQ